MIGEVFGKSIRLDETVRVSHDSNGGFLRTERPHPTSLLCLTCHILCDAIMQQAGPHQTSKRPSAIILDILGFSTPSPRYSWSSLIIQPVVFSYRDRKNGSKSFISTHLNGYILNGQISTWIVRIPLFLGK